MDTLNDYAYWMITVGFWLFLLCGVWLLVATLWVWLRVSKQDREWRLSWKQALKDLTLPVSGFAAAVMLLGNETSGRWLVYVGTLTFFLTGNLAALYTRRKEISVWRLVRERH